MQEIELDTPAMEWKASPSDPAGAESKVLFDENGSRTVLLRLLPGFSMDAHSHTCREQHFVLEGEYQADGKVFSAGAYRRIEPHVQHGPFASRDGAVVLVVWGP